MEEGRSEATLSKQENKVVLCEECKTKPFKYKCPGCSIRTCSLPCVKSHKQRTDCSGKRDQTSFVPLSQFDDKLLLSDFNLLEDVKRIAEAAQRTRVNLCGYPRFRLPIHLKRLQSAAARRRTKLWFLSTGMLKREKNQTKYNQRKKTITWTIEWRFHSTDIVLLEHDVHENTKLCTVIEKHLQLSPWNNKLREFSNMPRENLKFFICKYPKGSKSPFRELDLNSTLSHLLSNLVILEYPVIHVFLPSQSYAFEVVRDLRPLPAEQPPQEFPRDDDLTHSGVHFKEEEIEEDEHYPDAQILDHVHNSLESVSPDNNSLDGMDRTAKRTNEDPIDGLPCLKRPRVIAENVDVPLKESEAIDGKFDFDQDLVDVCSLLMEESNPDDYLKFEFDVGEESSDCPIISTDMLEVQELEEGEIPGSE